jgi:hypothetical protein
MHQRSRIGSPSLHWGDKSTPFFITFDFETLVNYKGLHSSIFPVTLRQILGHSLYHAPHRLVAPKSDAPGIFSTSGTLPLPLSAGHPSPSLSRPVCA